MFEQSQELGLRKLWTDLEPDEAPVVLVVGSETETGQVVLRPCLCFLC